MTTATASKAPSEAEIRAAIEARIDDGIDWWEAFHDVVLPIFEPSWQAAGHAEPGDAAFQPNPEWNVLWWDLAPSQAARLHELVTTAADRASKRCEAIILDELTAAGVQFATEYPEAPRP